VGSSIYHCLCELRYLLLRRFMQKQTIEYTTANADSAPSTHFGRHACVDNPHLCCGRFGLVRNSPTEVSKDNGLKLNYCLGFAVARSDRFTGYQPYLASSRYYPESSSLLRVRFVTGTPGRFASRSAIRLSLPACPSNDAIY
jgi:hypothetical protein